MKFMVQNGCLQERFNLLHPSNCGQIQTFFLNVLKMSLILIIIDNESHY